MIKTDNCQYERLPLSPASGEQTCAGVLVGTSARACGQPQAFQCISPPLGRRNQLTLIFNFKKIAYRDKNLNPVNKITMKKKQKGKTGLTGFSNAEVCGVLEICFSFSPSASLALRPCEESIIALPFPASARGGSQSDLERSRGSGGLPSVPETSGTRSLALLCLFRRPSACFA